MKFLQLLNLARIRGVRATAFAAKRRLAMFLTCAPPPWLWVAEASLLERLTRGRRNRHASWLPSSRLEGVLDELLGESTDPPTINAPSPEPRWHFDEVTDYEFPRKRANTLALISAKGEWDIRRVWERNRLHEMVTLALDARLSGLRRPGEEAIQLLDDWCSKNPIGRGINWTVAMEVAIRSINIATAITILGPNFVRPHLLRKVDRVLIMHLRFIQRNLELSTLHGNHLLADYLGILWISQYLAPSRFARKLRRKTWARLKNEAEIQLPDDGSPGEGSLGYHKLVVEMVFLATRMASAAGIDPDGVPQLEDRLRCSARFLMNFSDSSYRIPNFGDFDDGRVLRLWSNDVHDIYPLCSAIGIGSNTTRSRRDHDLHLLTGGTLTSSTRDPFLREPIFESGGWCCLHRGKKTVWTRFGGRTLEGRGHAHSDLLSICAEFDSEPLIVDPGTPPYGDTQTRRASISSLAHNAPVLNGLDISQVLQFPIPTVLSPSGRLRESSTGPEETSLDLSHDGYSDRGWGRLHRRMILTDSSLVVEDRFDETFQGSFQIHFCLSPDISIENHDSTSASLRLRSGSRVGFSLEHGGGIASLKMQFRAVAHYPHYGRAMRTYAIEIAGISRGPIAWVRTRWDSAL